MQLKIEMWAFAGWRRCKRSVATVFGCSIKYGWGDKESQGAKACHGAIPWNDIPYFIHDPAAWRGVKHWPIFKLTGKNL